MSRLPEFPNLMVMRTLSKLGLAGLRLGYAAARPEWLREVDKVRGPYNVGVLTQLVASKILSHHQVLEEQASEIILERGRVERSLHLMRGVKVFPSDANFLLLKVADAQRIYDGMKRRGVLVRTLHGSHPLLDNCLRFTIGTRSENDLLLDAFGKCIDAHE
jgi:histidinol-phosphate aminotransferase